MIGGCLLWLVRRLAGDVSMSEETLEGIREAVREGGERLGL